MLLVLPIFDQFVHTGVAPRGLLAQEIRSFDALALLVGLVKMASSGGVQTLLLLICRAWPKHTVRRLLRHTLRRACLRRGIGHFISGPQQERDGMTIDRAEKIPSAFANQRSAHRFRLPTVLT